jgi:two-component SAPR family response regulator
MAKQETAELADLTGLKVLVVEDTFLVAEVIAELLDSCGCGVVGPVPRVSSAMRTISEASFDGALLDVNLAGELCFPVAEELRGRGIPFVFLTGYDDSGIIPPEFLSVPRLAKPVDRRRLTEAIAGHFRR